MYSVLIVDDEPNISKGIRLILERSNFPISEINEAENGEQAIEMLKEKIYNIIITDIRMPKMDGLELSRMISKKCPSTAIIIVSGYADFDYAQKAIKYGVKGYLLKPVQRAEICQMISKVIDELKAYREVSYVEYRELETLADRIVSGIWSNQKTEIQQGLSKLYSISKDIPIEYCLKLQTDLAAMILGRLSLKLGYELRLNMEEYRGYDKEEFSKWFEGLVNTWQNEVNARRECADYNLFEMARQYIRENYKSDFSLEDLARKTGFSSSYFSQLFKSNTGKSFVQYRWEIRMQKAKELLSQANKTVTEVAMEIGYNDVTYFIKAFKEYTGLTPNTFKKERNRLHEEIQ